MLHYSQKDYYEQAIKLVYFEITDYIIIVWEVRIVKYFKSSYNSLVKEDRAYLMELMAS